MSGTGGDDRRRSFVRWAVFLIAIFGHSSLGLAQDDPKAYVGGEIDLSSFGVHSLTGSPSLSYENTTEDSTVFGVTVEAGTERGPLAVGAEINIPLGRSDITQQHGYFNPYARRSRYRDLSVFGIFHGYVSTGRRVRPGVFGGAGIVLQRSADRVATCNFDPHVPCSPFSAERETTRLAFAFTVGGDVVIAVARHLSVVPQLRIVWVTRGDPQSASSPVENSPITLGVSSPVYRGGIGLRIPF